MRRIQPIKIVIILSLICHQNLTAAELVSQNVNFKEPYQLGSLTITEGSILTSEQLHRDEIEEIQARDLKDVLERKANIHVGGGTSNTERLYLRGIEASNMNITLDGARQGQNLFQHRGGLSKIDPLLLKQIEIDGGPTGADQGAGALAGSLQMQTVDAQDLLNSGQALGAYLNAGYASADKSILGSLSGYGMLNEQSGLLFHFSQSDSDELRIGGGDKIPNSAADDENYLLKLSILDKDAHSLRVKAEYNENEGLMAWGAGDLPVEYYQALYEQGRAGGKPVRQALKRNSYTLNYDWQPSNPFMDWSFDAYVNDNELENFDDRLVYFSEGYGANLRNSMHFDLGGIQHDFSIGLDYFRDKGSSKTSSASVSNTGDNFGLFIQETAQIGQWELGGGLRHDQYRTEYGNKNVDGNDISPNLNMSYNVNDNLKLFAAYGESIRGAGTIPVGWAGRIVDDVILPTTGLKPEQSRQSEAGFHYFNSRVLNHRDQLQLELKLFETRIDNMISFKGGRGGKPVTEFFNLDGEFRSRGIDINLIWQYQSFQTSMGFNHTRLEDNKGEPVSVIRRFGAATGNTLVWDNRYRFSSALTAGYTLKAVKRLADVPDGEAEKPGYSVHSMRLVWEPKPQKGLKLSFAIENIFDKRYTDHTTIAYKGYNGIEETGRNIKLTLHYGI